MTDEVQVAAMTVRDDGAVAAFGCEGRKLLFVVMLRRFDVQPGSTRTVRWRIDRGVPRNQRWNNGPKGTANLTGRAAVALAKVVATARQRFVIQDDNGTVVFSVSGATAAIKRALSACGIEP